MNRRDFLLGTVASGIGLTTASLTEANPQSSAPVSRRRLARFVFMTDTHIRPTDDAMKWIDKALQKVASLKPDFVVHGGDLLDIAERQSIQECDATLSGWTELAKKTGLPFFYTLGNHDLAAVVGTNRDLTNPLSGKGFFKSRLGKGASYYAVDRPTMKLIVLDTVELKQDGGFSGLIEESQLAWLKNELESTAKTKPVVISCHIPIFSLVPEYDAGSDKPISPGMITVNGKQVFEIIRNHNVVAVLQGHTHSIEDLRYLKTKYITGGAVCGNWWKGNRFGVHEPGFALVEVYADRAEWSYQTYGWKA